MVASGNLEVLARYAKLLLNRGYEVTNVKTGAECLTLARKARPRLVVAGGKLPDMDSRALCRKVKSDPACGGSLVVLVDGCSQAAGRAQQAAGSSDLQPDDCLSDSVSVSELLDRTRLWLQLQAASEALRASEEKYRQLIDIVPDAIGVIDAQGQLLNVTAQTARMLGYDNPRPLLGKSIFELVSPDYHAFAQAELLETFKQGAVRSAEYKVLGKTGQSMLWQVSGAPMADGDGSAKRLLLFARDVTAEKLVQAALTERERSFRTVVETALEGVWMVDTSGATTYVNPSMAAMLGYPVREMLGRHLFDFLEGEERAVAAAALKLREEGVAGRNDCRFRRKDGTDLWAIVSAAPVLDEKGHYTGALGMVTDITERKQAAEALAASESRYRKLVELSPDAIYVVRDGRISFLNAAAVKLFGASSPAQLLGRTSLDLVPSEYHQELRQLRAKLLRDQAMNRGESKIRRLDEQVLDVSVSAAGFTDSEGPAVQVILRDITERKAIEGALQAAHRRVSVILDSITDGFTAFDRQWRYTYVNAAGARILRKKPEELLGKTLWQVWPGARESLFARECQHAMEENRPVEFVEFYPEPLNLWLESRSYPSADGLSVFFTDVTAHKRAEAELETLRQQLARVDRIQLTGELTAALSHELAQPLTAIASNARAAERFLLGAKASCRQIREILQDISRDAMRTVGVMQGVRSLLGAKKQQFAELDLNGLVEQTAQLVRSQALLNEVALSLDLARNLPPVLGDRVQLQQVLLNLVSNAFDAMKSGPSSKRRLTIGTSCSRKRFAAVRVRDTGEGIPPEYLSKLFNSFFTTKEMGMGMGLAICRSIIEAHGGRIWAAHNVDCGATFRFVIPLIDGGKL